MFSRKSQKIESSRNKSKKSMFSRLTSRFQTKKVDLLLIYLSNLKMNLKKK